ncbi:hypothetical protein KVT40_006909 [Elsinoe batatas]|uniref:Uncharacterized protein n=1 Tax=Elsinoe batatas TaxID=2601811 RepID=A0A8K0KYZ6_9PEZI|nr:hypothetical protein KVT40_006909 [Elsinoe batatas]
MSSGNIGAPPAIPQESAALAPEQHLSTILDSQGDDNYESAPDGLLLPPAHFHPFFTLVEDAQTGEHFHPAVHYIFSDDDPDTLTSSIIDTLQSEGEDPNHRLVLLDVANDGKTIRSGHSLSSAWQISQASIAQAPSWTEAGAEATTEGLMLKVEGAEAKKQGGKDKITEEPEDVVQRLESDIEIYTERLKHLQEVMAKSSML